MNKIFAQKYNTDAGKGILRKATMVLEDTQI